MPILTVANTVARNADRPIKRTRPNYRLVKIHRSYTVDEAARLLGVHKNTVRQWTKNGLRTIGGGRPKLIHGQVLSAFLKLRKLSRKRPCLPGQMYCVGCRAPKFPAAGMADYVPRTDKTGNLSGICPACNGMMYRRISLAQIEKIRGKLEITFPQALRRLHESSQPSVNSDLRGDVQI